MDPNLAMSCGDCVSPCDNEPWLCIVDLKLHLSLLDGPLARNQKHSLGSCRSEANHSGATYGRLPGSCMWTTDKHQGGHSHTNTDRRGSGGHTRPSAAPARWQYVCSVSSCCCVTSSRIRPLLRAACSPTQAQNDGQTGTLHSKGRAESEFRKVAGAVCKGRKERGCGGWGKGGKSC